MAPARVSRNSILSWGPHRNQHFERNKSKFGVAARGAARGARGVLSAEWASAHSKVCAAIRPRPCANHLAKNVGKKAAELGAKLHRTCSCPVKETQEGAPYKTGERLHKGCPNVSHPIVKALQCGIGAALRSAATIARATGTSIAEAGVAAVEEGLMHCMNVHEGRGAFTGQHRVCRFHDKPYESRTYITCPDLIRDLHTYVKKNIYDNRDSIFSNKGAVTQNSSERVGVGMVCLLYRQKGVSVNMDDVHYAAATDCGLLHVNGTVIEVFRRLLAKDNLTDNFIEEYGSWEERVHAKLGLSVTELQKNRWRAEVGRRAARSMYRKSDKYKVKRATMRRKQKQKRNEEKKTASSEYSYKQESNKDAESFAGKREGKGEPGRCTCGVTAKCKNRACPCLVASVLCTAACHGGRVSASCERCLPLAPRQDVEQVESDPEGDVASVFSHVADDMEP